MTTKKLTKQQKRERLERQRQFREEARRRGSQAAAGRRILRLPEVEAMVGLKKTSIYADPVLMSKSIMLTKKARGWIEEGVLEWQKTRIADRRAS
jgi:predicted DNA-binding transcriptional regulator AlpA